MSEPPELLELLDLLDLLELLELSELLCVGSRARKGYFKSNSFHATSLSVSIGSGTLAIRLSKRFSSNTAKRMSRRVSPGSITSVVARSFSSNLIAA